MLFTGRLSSQDIMAMAVRAIELLERRSRSPYVVVSLLTVFAVGAVDYVTGWELSFSVFYLLALSLATWFVGRGFGFFISVLSVAVSLAGDLAMGVRYSSRLVPWWNATILLTFYLVVTWLLDRLRGFYEELETRVKQRTAALTAEIAASERLERELLEISEREQRRIGHDLHDSLGQHLTSGALAGQVLAEKLSRQKLPEAADAAKVVEIVEDSIVMSRKLAEGLEPVNPEADGLMQALEKLATTSSELFHVRCRFECDSPVLIRDGPTSTHLYRIAQEGISNAIKHGKAKNVVIQLEAEDNGTALRVIDDGSGLPDPLPPNRGMGLRIMAHRAAVIGATFAARRQDTGGTVVTCLLGPMNGAQKGPHE